MAESTVGWFGVREIYCSLADKPWLISQILSSEQTIISATLPLWLTTGLSGTGQAAKPLARQCWAGLARRHHLIIGDCSSHIGDYVRWQDDRLATEAGSHVEAVLSALDNNLVQCVSITKASGTAITAVAFDYWLASSLQPHNLQQPLLSCIFQWPRTAAIIWKQSKPTRRLIRNKIKRSFFLGKR